MVRFCGRLLGPLRSVFPFPCTACSGDWHRDLGMQVVRCRLLKTWQMHFCDHHSQAWRAKFGRERETRVVVDEGAFLARAVLVLSCDHPWRELGGEPKGEQQQQQQHPPPFLARLLGTALGSSAWAPSWPFLGSLLASSLAFFLVFSWPLLGIPWPSPRPFLASLGWGRGQEGMSNIPRFLGPLAVHPRSPWPGSDLILFPLESRVPPPCRAWELDFDCPCQSARHATPMPMMPCPRSVRR